MWCLVVFQHDLHGQYLTQSKEKLLLKNILFLKGPFHLISALPLLRYYLKPPSDIIY